MSQEKGVIGGGHLGEQLFREIGLAAQSLAASADGPAIDGLGKGTMIFSINLGTFTGTPTFDAKIQQSLDGSTGWTDAATTGMFSGASVAIAQQSAGDQLIEMVVDTTPLQRYKRVAVTIGGGSPVCPTGIEVISHPTDRLPAA